MTVLMLVSAYCLSGITSSGAPVAPGTIAAPSWVPYGTSITMEGYVGRKLDSGGAIRGDRLDVWLADCAAARRWGVRRLWVTFGDEPPTPEESDTEARTALAAAGESW